MRFLKIFKNISVIFLMLVAAALPITYALIVKDLIGLLLAVVVLPCAAGVIIDHFE